MELREIASAVSSEILRMLEPRLLRYRRGVVSALPGGGRVTVKVGGSTTGVPARYPSWYTPAVNDVVELLQNGPDLVVFAKLA
ncbi:MAG: hypothetical protein LC640_09365 [Frankia sp.]|nr:hypothetical protein [Frankia sp.]